MCVEPPAISLCLARFTDHSSCDSENIYFFQIVTGSHVGQMIKGSCSLKDKSLSLKVSIMLSLVSMALLQMDI